MSEWKETDLGLIPQHWEIVPADKYCIKVTDGTHDSPKQQKQGKHLITSKHIKNKEIDFETAYLISEDDFNEINRRSKVDQWDLIISMIGEYCGFVYLENNKTIDYAVKNVGLFKVGNEINARWLYYYFISDIAKNQIRISKTGTSQPYLTLGSLREFPILDTSVKKEKEVIVSILSSLDNKIDLLRRQNQTLEQLAQTIFKQWFVHYQYPGATGQMETTELGDVPKGWKVGRLIELFELQRGFDLPTDTRTIGNHPVIAASGFSTMHDEYKVESPGIVTGRSGVIGNVYYIQENFWPLNTTLFIKSFNLSTPLHAYFILMSMDLNQYNSGSAVPSLNRNHVHETEIVIPTKNIISQFEETVQPLFKKKFTNEKEIQTLTQLRDSLLPRLMSGRLRVG